MQRRRHRQTTKNRNSVWFQGRQWPVTERLRIGRRTYLILKQLGRGPRCRYMALDSNGASGGELRSFLSVPASCEALRNVRLLKRISNQNVNLPQLIRLRING